MGAYWCGRQLARIGNKVVIEIGSTLVISLLVAHFGFNVFGWKSKIIERPKAEPPSKGWDGVVKPEIVKPKRQ